MRRKMFFGAIHLIFKNAKHLRDHVTAAEMIFWGRLKENFPEYRFRRQHPISSYIADFYCHKLKLVIEIDGTIHELEAIQRRDKEKEECFTTLGLTVLRFTNQDIKLRVEDCIKKIRNLINQFKTT